MRTLILVAAAALGLAACGNNDQADNTVNVDENLAAENIVSNDVTAIDAVTADAANMAADVEITNDLLDVGNNAADGTARPSRNRPSASSGAPASQEPATNAGGNSAE
jgi:hypothetical protein